MNAGTIFVLLLGLGFLLFVVYLAHLSRQGEIDEAPKKNQGEQESKDSDTPSIRRAG
jgi:hypothetical protein